MAQVEEILKVNTLADGMTEQNMEPKNAPVSGTTVASGCDEMGYLFVVTYGRSGSTILLNLLNKIDGFCIRGENHGIVTALAKSSSELATARSDYGNESADPTSPWYGIGAVHAEHYGRALAREFCRHVLLPSPDTRVIGFKEVRYSPRDISEDEYDATVQFLAENFENSRFIFNTRDCEEVANSGWWRHYWSKRQVKNIIDQSNVRFQRSRQILGDRAFTIDYGEYKSDPEGFKGLLAWLGESLDQQLIEEVVSTKLSHAVRKFRHRGLKSRLKLITRRFF